MPISQALLTIAIPTYNRSPFLDELLSSLCDQFNCDPRIELLVSDNASVDDTSQIIETYTNRGVKINYLRNVSNIGPDANFLQCFEQAEGKYVWLIGDDDLVIPGAIEKIMTYLQSADYSLVYVSSYCFEHSTEPNKVKVVHSPSVIKDARAFARSIHINLTFISGLIINKNRLKTAKTTTFSDLVGTNLVQLGWAYEALNSYDRGLYIHEKLVGMRTNNTGGYVLSQIFGYNLQAITSHRLKDTKVARSIINGTLMRFLPAAFLNLHKLSEKFHEEQAPDAIFKASIWR